jgi:octaprenyl-diphosphate synthase
MPYDINQVRSLIHASLAVKKLPITDEVLRYVFRSQGKYLRPRLILSLAENYSGSCSSAHYHIATATELLHNASLMHDDVIDATSMRRGVLTAHEVWSNKVSILGGDFILSKVFDLIAQTKNWACINLFTQASRDLTEGELLQLTFTHHIITAKEYLQIIRRKTSLLFALSLRATLEVSNASNDEKQAAFNFGINYGNVFQLRDDVMDYFYEDGKGRYNDIKEHKLTWPLMVMLARCPENLTQQVQQHLLDKGAITNQLLSAIRQAMVDYNVQEHCVALINKRVDNLMRYNITIDSALLDILRLKL